MLKHELQLKKWRSKLKLRVNSKEEYISPERNVSEVFLVGEIPEFDVSQLPKRTVLQVRMNSYVLTSYFHNVCLKSGFMNFA